MINKKSLLIALVLLVLVSVASFANIRQGQYKASNGYVLVIVIEGNMASIRYYNADMRARSEWIDGQVQSNGNITFTLRGSRYQISFPGVRGQINENYENLRYTWFSDL